MGGYDGATGACSVVQLESRQSSLQYHGPVDRSSWVTIGVSELASSNANRLAALSGKTTYYRVQEGFLNGVHNFTVQIRAELDFSRNTVFYGSHSQGVNDRLQVSTWYRF